MKNSLSHSLFYGMGGAKRSVAEMMDCRFTCGSSQ